MHGKIREGEIGPCKEHEDGDHIMDIRGIPVCNAGRLGGIPSGCHGGKGMTDGIEESHISHPQQQYLHDGEDDIDGPQPFCCLLDLGMQLIGQRSGYLGHKQLHAAYTEQWKYGQ